MSKKFLLLTIATTVFTMFGFLNFSKAEIDITNNNLYNSLKGKIILKVEANGEAYYVSPDKQKMYFLSRPADAFKVMREQGIGITNSDLEKIPVARNFCSNNSSQCEISNDVFANKQKGKIFLQVEENGEAWYVNPNDSRRYFMGRPSDAFSLMRNLGLGISNADFEKLVLNNSETREIIDDITIYCDEYDIPKCLPVVAYSIVDLNEKFAVVKISNTNYLLTKKDGEWSVSIASQEDNICETGSGNTDFVEYCKQ